MTKIALLAALLLAPAAKAADLQVVSNSPAGQSPRSITQITATFSRPMVSLTAPAQSGEYCPVEITPPLKGRCRWMGTQTLSFEPESALDIATFYKVKIPKGAKSQVYGDALPADYEWSFETPRPQLLESKPSAGQQWIDLDATLFARFNLPMQQSRMRDFAVLEERDAEGKISDIPLGVRHAAADEIKTLWGEYSYEQDPAYSTSAVMALKPYRRLKKDCAYRLVFKKDLPAETGDIGLAAERVVEFKTWRAFGFAGVSAAQCLPGDYGVKFTNPVAYSELLRNLSVEPSAPIAPPKEDWRANSTGNEQPNEGVVYQPLPDMGWRPGAVFKFKLSGNLRDAYGNVLGKDEEFSITAGDYCPAIRMSGGFGIVESYLKPRHPVTAINITAVALAKALVPDDDIIPLYSKMEKANPSDKLEIPAGAEKLWRPADKPNASFKTFADLSPALAPGGGGTVFLQLSDNEGKWLRALDNVARVGVTLKTSPDSSLVWASYLKTGAPAPGLPVEIRGNSNKILWRGLTDKDGFALAPGWGRLGLAGANRWERPRLWAFVKDGQGTAVLASDFRGGIEPWRFNIYSEFSPAARHYDGLFYAERGVYRPGEAVNLKAVLRRLDNGDWKYPDLRAVQVAIRDARGTEVYKSTLPVSALGSFALAYTVGENAPTGGWEAVATEMQPAGTGAKPAGAQCEGGECPDYSRDSSSGGLRLSASFRVEAFKPALFEVKLTPDATQYFQRDAYRIYAEGWYLYGAPLADAPADWKLRFENGYFLPPGWDGFSFGRYGPGPQPPALLSGAAKLDADGKAVIETKLPEINSGFPLTAIFEGSVTSPERQKLFSRKEAVIHPSEVYAGVKRLQREENSAVWSPYFIEAGKPLTLLLAAVRYDGAPSSGTALDCALSRRETLSVQRAGVAGRLEWVNDTRNVEITTFTVVSSSSPYAWDYMPDKPGAYSLDVQAADAKGRISRTEYRFDVSGEGEAWWERRDNDIIELVADKDKYKPGDTAKIMVKSPYSRTRAVVTVEREGVLERGLVRLNGGADYITVPIKDAHVPNIYVGVMLVQGRSAENKFDDEGLDLGKPQSKFGYVSLNVDPGGRRLSVSVETDKKEYRPGGEVTLRLKTTRQGGAPESAELAVAVVDEGVLALTGYGTPDLFGPFYGARPLQIQTADSRLFVIGQRNFGEKGESRGGGGAGGLALSGVDLRAKFVPTAYWNPSAKTGADGRAEVKFTLPGNITRFRVMVTAHSERLFGSGEAGFTTAKPLALRPGLPRFARPGDAFSGGVIVSNYTGAASTVTVTVEPSGDALRVGEGWLREVYLPRGGSKEIAWDMSAVRRGAASLRFRAASGAETDGLEWPLKVIETEQPQTGATGGVTESSVAETVEKPKTPVSDAQVEITMSPTAFSRLKESVRFLAEYPYGCLEQKLSGIMPALAGGELVSEFGLGDTAYWTPLAQKTLDSLADYQHPSGGFGYWAGDSRPDPYLTAYALDAVNLAERGGWRVDKTVSGKAAKWLADWLDAQRQWAYPYSQAEVYAARAYALYALAVNGDSRPGLFAQLYAVRGQLPLGARAWLLKAAPYMTSAEETQKSLAAELLSLAKIAPQSLHFEDSDGLALPWLHESAAKTTGVCLEALLSGGNGFAGAEKAARWLLDEQKTGGRWRTTHENAAVVRALVAFHRLHEKGGGTFSAYAFSEPDGQRKLLWAQEFVDRKPDSGSRRFRLDVLSGISDTAKIIFTKSGPGRLYYGVSLRYTPASYEAKEWEGFEIEKKIEPLKGGGALKAPERAVVTLTVRTKQDRPFVALTDRLPAGFEIVDPSFAVESGEDAVSLRKAAGGREWWGGFARHEIYDDKIMAFADYLTAGEHKYSYLVQAVTPGKFSLPAAYVEQMYEPEVYGRTASGNVEIGR